MYRVLIPDAVAEELERRPGAYGGGAPSLGFVERRTPVAGDVGRVASEPSSLDALQDAGMYLKSDLRRRVMDRFRTGEAL